MNEVQGTLEAGTLSLKLSGRIDSLNAADVGKEIAAIMGEEPVEHIRIDAGELEYISSAGLRVILRLRKRTEDVTLASVNPEVYEILEMTGFTEMMQVEKAYRQVSVEGCEVIGEGANGTLYRIDRDNVVKVYNNADALTDIQHEREVARLALVLGIPTAISYDVVRVGDHYGSVFELLDASSFANILQKDPGRIDWCVQEFVRMLKKIHGTVVPKGKLPAMKETVLGWAEFMKDYLPEESWQKLNRLIQEVPEDDHMIHGDYHIKNLELQGDEVLLIDMDTLAVGHPVFELGSMYNAFAGFSEYNHKEVERFMGISRELSLTFWHKVLAGYLGTEEEEKIREVEDKARIIGYLRLIRRSIRRNGLEHEDTRAEIDLWKENLLSLLERVETLLFSRNELTVDAREDRLPEVLGFISSRLEAAGCDPRTMQRIEVASEEIFINIARYAYKAVTGPAAIRAEVRELSDVQPEKGARKEAVITFIDEGVPFDPLAKEDPDVSLTAEARSIGGLGIYMVKKTMDEVSYKFEDGKNQLTIRKRF